MPFAQGFSLGFSHQRSPGERERLLFTPNTEGSILALPRMLLGKYFHLFEPQPSLLKNGDNNNYQ